MTSRDFLIAGRILRKNPVFTLTAVLTIGLGVGASTAIFSVTNAVLLQPLPYTNPDGLVIAGMDLRQRSVYGLPLSNADFIDLRDGTRAFFDDFATVDTGRLLVSQNDGTTEQIRQARVTTNFFALTGGQIVLGRNFTQEDGVPQPPLPPPGTEIAPPRLPLITILSYEYFQRRYGGNAEVVGHMISTTGGPGLFIVGVLAPRFHLYFPPEANVESAPDVWIANRLTYDAGNRNEFFLNPVGRLRQGISLERAQAAADQVAAEARKNFAVAATAGYYIRLEPMHRHLVAEVRPAILALMGSVVFLLLIACANVTNLLLVRTSLRERELAVRSALGANRWRLVSPLLAESIFLAAIGTLAGVGLAWIGIRELGVLAPANLPRLENIRIDPYVLAFSAMAGLCATAIFGTAPLWRASRPQITDVLRGSSRTAGFAAGAWLRNLVVMAEVALSFVLLIGSGLMLRSFLQLERIDPGFDPHHLLTFQLFGVRAVSKTPEQRSALIREIKERITAISGVQNVTASSPFPLTGDFWPIRWGTEEALSDPSKFRETDFQIVLPGYFETMHTPLLAGRTFTSDDNLPGRDGVIIDQYLASKAFPGRSAVGKRILIRIRTPEAEWVEVVGVVGHQRTTSLAEPGREQVYFTDAFDGSGVVRVWALRTGSDAANYANQVRVTVAGVDPHLVVTAIESGEVLVARAQAGTRFSLLLITVFAVVAGTLAGVGLYGVLSTSVRQRTSEIGVRVAVGARPGNIFLLVVGQGLRLSVAGIVTGVVAAFLLTRAMSAMLVGVKPTDPLTFACMTLLFLGISALASWLPARRAAGLDPTTALRDQ